MKTLYIIPILAIVLAVAGCTSGSTGKTITVIEPPPEALPTDIDVTIVEPAAAAAPVQLKPARIDAVSFLDALIESGCVIDKAAYKEVARGGGIVVTCRASDNSLKMQGLEDLE
ncbi:MAG: hypothetical protein DRQ39_08375 [Gammaproteobacteria bacterium]|nr:MAG: hypothetical protein DRQ39_08375 [Gammaproteobacteria bacterium]